MNHNQISRHGVYGVLLKDSHILLTKQSAGPYKGKWGLPGGGIEFGESFEDTIVRELLEESALIPGRLEFLMTTSSTMPYVENNHICQFHQTGLIYKIYDWTGHPDCSPEDVNLWAHLNQIDMESLTPIAQKVIDFLSEKQTWRPPKGIRGKVIALVKNGQKILVSEVLDDHFNLKGWVSPGGGIDYGESAKEALKREIKEELGCEITILGEPTICENLFAHHGIQGHEIIFAFPVRLSDDSIYQKQRFKIIESKGNSIWTEWIDIEEFLMGRQIFFPQALIPSLHT